MNFIRRTLLPNILEYLVGVLFSVLTAITILGVFYRYVLNNPLAWTEELGRYLMIWMTLFAATVAVKRGTHLKLDLNLFRFFPEPAARIGRVAINFFIMVFLVVMTYKGVQYCKIAGAYPSAMLRIPMAYVWSVVPLSGFLMMVFLSYSIWTELRKKSTR